jgi:hypothetical protein
MLTTAMLIADAAADLASVAGSTPWWQQLFTVGGPTGVICGMFAFLIYKGIPSIIKRSDDQQIARDKLFAEALAARDKAFAEAVAQRDAASRRSEDLYERTLTTIRAEHRADRNADRAEFVAAIKGLTDAVHEMRQPHGAG